jgi:hypothetical protein
MSDDLVSQGIETRDIDTPEPVSVRGQLAVIAEDIRSLFNSELSYYKARFSYTQQIAKWAGLYLLVAICAFFGGIIAFILGILLIVSSYIGPLWATLLITLISLSAAVLFAILARNKSQDFRLSEIDEDSKSDR